MECGNDELVNELKIYKGNLIRNPCKINNCLDPHTHTTRGHSCLYCDKREDIHLKNCPNYEVSTSENSVCDSLTNYDKDFTEQVRSIIINNNEYTSCHGGMGCTWFIRNNNGYYEYLFMHSDCWGQYGEEVSHLPRYKAFIYGYIEV